MSKLIYIFVILSLLTGCTSILTSDTIPFPFSPDDSSKQSKLVTIPLPVIASSPNEGITSGALGALLLHNEKDEIYALLAPQVNYNDNFGVSSSLYGAFYPSPVRNWEINISKSTDVNSDYEYRITDRSFFEGRLELNALLYHFNDGSARFFGFQSESPRDDETNYNDKETGFTFSGSYNFWKHLSIQLGDRYRQVKIKRGAVRKIPFILDLFDPEDIPGSKGFRAHSQKFGLIYSTLDTSIAPTFG